VRLNRRPTTPGEILRKEFLEPLRLTQAQLANHIGCHKSVINGIVNGRHRLSAGIAIRLGAALRMTPEFWLNAQRAVDLYDAARRLKRLPRPVSLSPSLIRNNP